MTLLDIQQIITNGENSYLELKMGSWTAGDR